MTQPKHFPLPDVGEGLTEAEILHWRVQPGDTVSLNQVIVEIETAKAAVELPCPFAGRVTELLAEPGQTVEVGTPIITIDPESEGPPGAQSGAPSDVSDGRVPTLVGYGPRASSTRRRARKAPIETGRVETAPAATAPVEPGPVGAAPAAPAEVAASARIPLAKPPVRKLASDLGVDLRRITGSGTDGVITREDVQAAVAPAPAAGARERRVPVKSVRRATAAAMVQSAFTAPHVTEFLAVDVTPMMELRKRLQARPEFDGVRLTPLAFAAKAACLAVRRTPEINATWDEDAAEIIYKEYVHLGIAAATPRGLVVPKIRDADTMSLRDLAVSLEELATTARDGRTAPADLVNGTFTITNVGVFGVDAGTPILNPGESGILAFGAIRDQPWVVDGQVVPRKVCQLALSFDHRIVDGQQGSRFLADVGALLADPGLAITY